MEIYELGMYRVGKIKGFLPIISLNLNLFIFLNGIREGGSKILTRVQKQTA
jgi:hypothetical protein